MKDKLFETKDKGIFLVDKNIKLICARKKKEIILPEMSRAHVGKPIFLCGKSVYGIIELNEPQAIDEYQFKSRYKRHLITDIEREQMWPVATKYYAYSFRIKRIFKESLEYVNEEEVVGFMKSINFSLDVKSEGKVTLEKDFYNYYGEVEELEKLVAIEGYGGIQKTLLQLYKLLIQKMELKATDTKRKRCTAADRRAGRCGTGQIYRHTKYDNYNDTTGFIKAPKVDVTENLIRVRLREPSTIVKDSFKTITLSESKGIKAVIGKLKTDPDGGTHTQSVLFDKDKWESSTALTWVTDHEDSLKHGIVEGSKDKANKSVTATDKINCLFCEKDFNFMKEEWQEGVDGIWMKCPYCEKLEYYAKVKN